MSVIHWLEAAGVECLSNHRETSLIITSKTRHFTLATSIPPSFAPFHPSTNIKYTLYAFTGLLALFNYYPFQNIGKYSVYRNTSFTVSSELPALFGSRLALLPLESNSTKVCKRT